MAKEIRLDLTTRLIILILFVIIFIKTLNLSEARRAKRILQKLAKELELGEEISPEYMKEEEEVGEEKAPLLTQDVKEYIVRAIKNRHYSRAKRKLEKLGYTNVRIRKRMNLIIIECDQGKDVIVLND